MIANVSLGKANNIGTPIMSEAGKCILPLVVGIAKGHGYKERWSTNINDA